MNTQKILIIIGIVIIALIGWWSFGGDTEILDTDDETSQEETVTNTNQKPSTVTTNNQVTNPGPAADPNAIAPVPTGDSNVETNTPPVSETESGPEVTVRYTNIGFLPKTLTVEVGTKVTFINESTGNMQIASDNHPSHTILPELNQESAVNTDGTHSYIFDTIGSWGFHNHARPEHQGTIFVNPK